MENNRNVVIFKFGESLNLMFKIIDGIVKSKGDKKSLILTSRLTIVAKEKDKCEVYDFKEELLSELSLNDYKIIIVESDFDEKYLEITNKEEYKDLLFLFTTNTNKDSSDKVIYCDLENMDKLPMIQKMMKINDMRKALSVNKTSKKWKLFK